MSADSRHVAVDLGASGGRVALGVVKDGRLEVEVLHRFPNGGVPVQGGLYWDVFGLWREILHGLKLAGQRGTVASVGVNSWGVDYALLDENDLVLDGVHHYRDSRNDGVMENVLATTSRDRMYGATGIQFMPINTVFQLVAHEQRVPGILSRARRLLMVPDLFHFWLCGQSASEITIASTTQLYNPINRSWSLDIIDSCEIPAGLFADLIEPGSTLGVVSPLSPHSPGFRAQR